MSPLLTIKPCLLFSSCWGACRQHGWLPGPGLISRPIGSALQCRSRSRKDSCLTELAALPAMGLCFLSWNECWSPASLHFLCLDCKMVEGRREGGLLAEVEGINCGCLRKLPSSAICNCSRQERKICHSQTWEAIFLSRAALCCFFHQKYSAVDEHRIEQMIDRKMFQYWKGWTVLALPVAGYREQMKAAVDHACKEVCGRSEVAWAETKWQTWNDSHQVKERWGACWFFRNGWRVACCKFNESNTHSLKYLAGLGHCMLLAPVRNKSMQEKFLIVWSKLVC